MNGLNYPPHRSSSGLTFIAGHVYGSLPAHIFLQILFLSSNKLYICLLLVSEKCPVGKHHLSRKRTIYQINQYLVTVDLLNFLLCAYKVSVKSYIVVGQSKGIWTWTVTLIRKKKNTSKKCSPIIESLQAWETTMATVTWCAGCYFREQTPRTWSFSLARRTIGARKGGRNSCASQVEGISKKLISVKAATNVVHSEMVCPAKSQLMSICLLSMSEWSAGSYTCIGFGLCAYLKSQVTILGSHWSWANSQVLTVFGGPLGS